ncbi:hypothetical protein HHK36_007956 [Tetracentron sinense]|uniref:S-locus glycoprotein domain-containing protein n=1 Tax=Tetracentron sinense TaxID=13715 RepID=A0A834ZIP5_TETSI|nr:hypothetical protein HHK36_007956 [Tetracentron sinense]
MSMWWRSAWWRSASSSMRSTKGEELNWTDQGGLFSLSVTASHGLIASIGSNPPQVYYNPANWGPKQSKEASYAKFLNGSLALFILSAEPKWPDDEITVPPASSSQVMKFGSDGHLRIYDWTEEEVDWKEVADLLTGDIGECEYPMVCGNYGICSKGECSCPEAKYFRPILERQPNLGCSQVTPLSCGASQNHILLELKDITYFSFTSKIIVEHKRISPPSPAGEPAFTANRASASMRASSKLAISSIIFPSPVSLLDQLRFTSLARTVHSSDELQPLQRPTLINIIFDLHLRRSATLPISQFRPATHLFRYGVFQSLQEKQDLITDRPLRPNVNPTISVHFHHLRLFFPASFIFFDFPHPSSHPHFACNQFFSLTLY